jgi:hypothetical protein
MVECGAGEAYSRRVATIPQAGDDTSDDEVGEGGGAGLKKGTNAHNAGAEHDHGLTTERVSNPNSDNSTDEAPKIVRRNGDTCAR